MPHHLHLLTHILKKVRNYCNFKFPTHQWRMENGELIQSLNQIVGSQICSCQFITMINYERLNKFTLIFTHTHTHTDSTAHKYLCRTCVASCTRSRSCHAVQFDLSATCVHKCTHRTYYIAVQMRFCIICCLR